MPIAASPRTGLYDERAVTVHGEGWPAVAQLEVAQCAANSFPAAIKDCAMQRSVVVTPTESGSWDVRIYVVRTVILSDRTVDCAVSRCTIDARVVDGTPLGPGPKGLTDRAAVGSITIEFDPSEPARPTREGIAPKPVQFDLDDDGQLDELWLQGIMGQAQLWVRLTTGAESYIRTTADDASIYVRPFNDRPLIFFAFSGNTHSTASIATFADGRLLPLAVEHPLGGDQIGWVGWQAHSNCCPQATEDVACFALDGRTALVLTSSILVDRAGNIPGINYRSDGDYQRRWNRRAYVLDGDRLVKIRDDNGTIELDAQAPPGVPLENSFAC